MQTLLDLPQTWTFKDLERALPEDADWRRYEIVDGALVVSPSPSPRHEFVSTLIRRAIVQALPADLIEVANLGIDLGRSYRVPDLLVAPRRVLAGTTAPLRPSDVLLAVEIVSPSSTTTDRITKPAQYAAAGIAAYWRAETEPETTLTAYTLAPGAEVYAELGSWGPGETAVLDVPFPAIVPIDNLTPRP